MDKKHYKMWATVECSFCIKAQELFLAEGIPHETIILSRGAELDQIKERYNHATVPIIIEKGTDETERLVGGYTDLALDLGVEI